MAAPTSGPAGHVFARRLAVDKVSDRTWSQIIRGLRTARLDADLTQNEVASDLPVRGRAVSEWEIGTIEPALDNLIMWCHRLRRRLVIIGRNGELVDGPVRQRPGEPWVIFERRRLATPLGNRRRVLGLSQEETGRRVGVSRDSISRWELARVPMRPMGLVVWAQTLDRAVALVPIDTLDARPHRLAESGRTAGGWVPLG